MMITGSPLTASHTPSQTTLTYFWRTLHPPGQSTPKPWITPEIKVFLKENKRAFKSGDREELITVQRKLRRNIRGKSSYRWQREDQLQNNDQGSLEEPEDHLWV